MVRSYRLGQPGGPPATQMIPRALSVTTATHCSFDFKWVLLIHGSAGGRTGLSMSGINADGSV